jgi:anaerobic C4-dicarboxylate transporter
VNFLAGFGAILLTFLVGTGRSSTAALPITLKTACQVGDILKYVPDGTTPDPRYRFYM